MNRGSIYKIIALIVVLNWIGVSFIPNTFAYFNDIENSNNNVFQTSLFDFS